MVLGGLLGSREEEGKTMMRAMIRLYENPRDIKVPL